ncbi:MAG: BatA domain-containing protein [Mucilaginibacter sp.]
MILLNSIWLYALAALCVPVAIHLWNIRQGKTLKVGSIALINTSSQKSSRSFKLHDLLLLVLRCLLVALLAFVLAMPLWQRHISSSGKKGWVMLPKENLTEVYQKFKPEIDSLTKKGYEFHYFNRGFPKAELAKILPDNKQPESADSSKTSSYWTLIQQLDQQIPLSLPVYLFTPNTLAQFTGSKPSVAINLHWQTFAPADSTATWIESAWLSNNNDIHVRVGNSGPENTRYINYVVQPGSIRNVPVVVNSDNGRLTVNLKNNSRSFNVDTSTSRFAIVSDKNATDAKYVNAALQAVIQFTGHKAVIENYSNAGQIKTHQNWVFWLKEGGLREKYLGNIDNIFTYAEYSEFGAMKDINSWIGDRASSTSKIGLSKLIYGGHGKGETIWQSGFGDPVLTRDKYQHTNIYYFFTRFDPAYNDLVWSDDFPKMLLRLIAGHPSDVNTKYDRRVMNAKQLLPVLNKENNAAVRNIKEFTNLTHYFWLLLVLIFMTERWVAHKKTAKQVLKNG